jgi:hypothetical protein
MRLVHRDMGICTQLELGLTEVLTGHYPLKGPLLKARVRARLGSRSNTTSVASSLEALDQYMSTC